MSTPPEPVIAAPFRSVTAPTVSEFAPSASTAVAPSTVTAPVFASVSVAWPRASVPADTVVPAEKVLVPSRVQDPAPVFASATSPVPLSPREAVSVFAPVFVPSRVRLRA